MVHDGQVDVDDDTRALLEQVRRIWAGSGSRPHLTIVLPPEDEAGDANVTGFARQSPGKRTPIARFPRRTLLSERPND